MRGKRRSRPEAAAMGGTRGRASGRCLRPGAPQAAGPRRGPGGGGAGFLLPGLLGVVVRGGDERREAERRPRTARAAEPSSSPAFQDDHPRSAVDDPVGTSLLTHRVGTPREAWAPTPPGGCCQCRAPRGAGESHSPASPWQPFPPAPRPSCMVWVPLRTPRTDRRAPLRSPSSRCTTMSLEWLMDWSWSLDGLRDFIATSIQSFRDCDATALAAVAFLLLLFLWYCYQVGREQPRASYPTVNALMQGAEANGVQNGYVYCHSPECVRCAHHDGLNQKLYHNLQEYAKRYSWSGMGRIHKGIREQGRYLNSRPSIQKPEVFFLPDLPTMPYFSRDAQKHDVELLERNFQTILCEFETLYKAFSNCSLPQGWKMNSTPSGEWFTFYLVNQGMCVPRNCRRCPRTYRLLGSLRTCIGNNVFGNACISVLSPGTVIAEHYGPTNIRIRCHLGLKTPSNCELVVGGEPQCWAEGRCLLFDDSFLHTAFHEGPPEEGPRVVFMVDLWHPNVAAAERQALDFIFAPGR